MITESIKDCDVDIKKELYSNMLMTRGNILYGNLQRQIELKVAEMVPLNAKVKEVAMMMAGERKYSQWWVCFLYFRVIGWGNRNGS